MHAYMPPPYCNACTSSSSLGLAGATPSVICAARSAALCRCASSAADRRPRPRGRGSKRFYGTIGECRLHRLSIHRRSAALMAWLLCRLLHAVFQRYVNVISNACHVPLPTCEPRRRSRASSFGWMMDHGPLAALLATFTDQSPSLKCYRCVTAPEPLHKSDCDLKSSPPVRLLDTPHAFAALSSASTATACPHLPLGIN